MSHPIGKSAVKRGNIRCFLAPLETANIFALGAKFLVYKFLSNSSFRFDHLRFTKLEQ